MSFWFRRVLFSLTMLSVTAACSAKDALHSDMEAANLEKALYCMEILENRPDLEPVVKIEILLNECFAENYIQHSPHVQDGRDAVLEVFARRYENHPDTSISIKRTASEGDLVWIHLHIKRNDEDLGRAVMHIFRMEDGKFAEHWGVVQAVPENPKNNNTMF